MMMARMEAHMNSMKAELISTIRSTARAETKANTSHCSPTRGRLGPRRPQNRTAKRPRRRAHSTGSRGRTTTRVEGHSRQKPDIQKLLGPVEIARREKRRTRARLGIPQRTNPCSPNHYSSEQS
jgi:hypothetical protein